MHQFILSARDYAIQKINLKWPYLLLNSFTCLRLWMFLLEAHYSNTYIQSEVLLRTNDSFTDNGPHYLQ